MSIIEPEGKSVVRTFRLDRAWDDAIQEEADKKDITLSGMLEKIVRDYISFYRWVEAFNSIIFQPNTIKALVDALDERQLKEIGEKVGKSSIMESFLIKGDAFTREMAEHQIIDQMSHYAHWFTATTHDSKKPYLYIQHTYGPKWTAFVEAYITSFYSNVLSIKVKCEKMDNNLIIRLME